MMDTTGLIRGNGAVVIASNDSKAAKDAQVFISVLKLPSMRAPNKHTVPPQHYKLVLKDATDLKATLNRLMNTRATTDGYQHVCLRADISHNTIYLWHDRGRVKRERNPNKPFAGESQTESIT